MDKQIRLAYTGWGGYIVDGSYWNIGVEVCEKLLKHWGTIRALENSDYYKLDNYIAKEIKDLDEFRNIVQTQLKNISTFQAVFFNPLVHEEPYVHRLSISKTAMSILEYEGGKYFKLNKELTDHFITAMKDIAQIKEIQELWLVNRESGFMGNIYFLYRPEKIYCHMPFPETYPQLQELLNLLQAHLPKEVIIDTIVKEIGKDSIEFLNDDKIFVRFYRDHLFDVIHERWSLLEVIQKRVESYLINKNVPIHKLVR